LSGRVEVCRADGTKEDFFVPEPNEAEAEVNRQSALPKKRTKKQLYLPGAAKPEDTAGEGGASASSSGVVDAAYLRPSKKHVGAPGSRGLRGEPIIDRARALVKVKGEVKEEAKVEDEVDSKIKFAAWPPSPDAEAKSEEESPNSREQTPFDDEASYADKEEKQGVWTDPKEEVVTVGVSEGSEESGEHRDETEEPERGVADSETDIEDEIANQKEFLEADGPKLNNKQVDALFIKEAAARKARRLQRVAAGPCPPERGPKVLDTVKQARERALERVHAKKEKFEELVVPPAAKAKVAL